MTTLSLREAAERAGTSKSTIFRAIRAGRLSAGRDEDGNFQIDPAELFRVYPPKTSEPKAAEVAPVRDADRAEGHGATTHDTTELRVRNAELEGQISVLRLLLETAQKREEDLKGERDRWAAQAERLALAPPQPSAVAASAQQRGWWPFRRAG